MKTARFRPTSLRIFGRNFSIQYKPRLEAWGVCHRDRNLIEIVEDQQDTEEADTILHETLHALFYHLNFDMPDKKEEAIVRPLATGLMQVFLDNPEFLKYLLKVAQSQNRSR